MAKQIDRQALYGRWMHSREEDTAAERVFRPADYEFPRTRAVRDAIGLEPDGRLVLGTPAPDDSQVETDGTWRLEGDCLTLSPGQGAPTERWTVLSADKDRLVVRKA
jgi:hypothetical protein